MTPLHLHVREWLVRGSPKGFAAALRLLVVAPGLGRHNLIETATLVLDAMRRGEETPDETEQEALVREHVEMLMRVPGIQALDRCIAYCTKSRRSFKVGRPRAEDGPRPVYGRED